MKTKEILKGMLFLAGIVMLSAACIKKDDPPKLDFNITVPATWSYYVLNANNIVYYAQSPVESQTDSITEDIMITKDAITNLTLEQFSSSVISTLDNDTSFHTLYFSGDTTINGATCRRLLHLQIVKQPVAQTRDTIYLEAEINKYFFVRNNYGYVISMNALVASYPVYKSIFADIISTFAFKN